MKKNNSVSFNDANLHVSNLIVDMLYNYEKDGKKFYSSLGRHLVGYINEDMNICHNLAKVIMQ